MSAFENALKNQIVHTCTFSLCQFSDIWWLRHKTCAYLYVFVVSIFWHLIICAYLYVFVAVEQETGQEPQGFTYHAVLGAVQVVQGTGYHIVVVQGILYILNSLQLSNVAMAERENKLVLIQGKITRKLCIECAVHCVWYVRLDVHMVYVLNLRNNNIIIKCGIQVISVSLMSVNIIRCVRMITGKNDM